MICTAGTRKKTEYKQLPPGYAEVLENTQLVLVATVQKLYSMVRNGEGWALGEPELNDRGQPVVHNVASKLGCLRPNSDVDLPPNATFPEDAAGMAELARQLRENAAVASATTTAADPMGSGMDYSRTDRAGSMPTSDAGISDLDAHDADYSTTAFGGAASSAVSMSPASLTYDFEYASSDGFPPSQHSPAMPQQQPQQPNTTYTWFNRPSPMQQQQQQQPQMTLNLQPQTPQQLQQHLQQQQMDLDLSLATDVQAQQMWAAANQAAFMGAVLPGQAALAPYGFGGAAACRDTKIMMLRGDPLIYTGCDDEDLRSQLANAEA